MRDFLRTPRVLTLVLITLLSLELQAGGWISSGGELFRFDKNPWFVKNTETVFYCVNYDPNGMSISKENAERTIREVFDFWKDEFGKARKPDKSFVSLATQEFVQVEECSLDLDLRFNLGYASLDQKELEFLKDPTKYVGVTVRTSDYGKDMKGKGFIFISSDRGEHAYQNKGHLINRAWENEKLFKYALIHEMGHVFGMSHSNGGLMSEVFMDELLHKRFHKEYLEAPLKSVLHPPREAKVCALSGKFNPDFFGAEKTSPCLKLVQNGRLNYEITELGRGGEEVKKLGEVKFFSADGKEFGAKPSTIVHLPDGQKVFGVNERFINSFMIGPLYTDISGTGSFFKEGSLKPYHLFIEYSPERISFVAEFGGRLQTVLSYSYPSLMKKIIPGIGN